MKKGLRIIIQALKKFTSNRFYLNERAFLGELNSQLTQLHFLDLLPEGTIIEEEAQKANRLHGMSSRPDLAIHQPFDDGLTVNRQQGNFLVFELDKKSSNSEAKERINKLEQYIDTLDYEYGVFININSDRTFVEHVRSEKIHVFCIKKRERKILITHAYLHNEHMLSKKYTIDF